MAAATLLATLILAACGGSEPTDSETLSSIAVTPGQAQLQLDDSLRLVAEGRTNKGSPVAGLQFTWSSSDPGVVAVSSSGVVTAVSAGSASISAQAAGKSGMATVTVAAPVCTTTPSLVVALAAGVSGSPGAGESAPSCGAEVTYQFQLGTGYRNLQVTIDGVTQPVQGRFRARGNHLLIASAQAAGVVPPGAEALSTRVGELLTAPQPAEALQRTVEELVQLRQSVGIGAYEAFTQALAARVKTAADSQALRAVESAVKGTLIPIGTAAGSSLGPGTASGLRPISQGMAPRTTSVIYINGIANTLEVAVASAVELNAVVLEAGLSNTHTYLAYNPTAPVSALGCFLELQPFWLVDPQCGKASDVLQSVGQLLGARPGAEALTVAASVQQGHLAPGRQVVLVGHSQGNLFIQDVLERANAIPSAYKKLIGVISLAAPGPAATDRSVLGAFECWIVRGDVILRVTAPPAGCGDANGRMITNSNYLEAFYLKCPRGSWFPEGGCLPNSILETGRSSVSLHNFLTSYADPQSTYEPGGSPTKPSAARRRLRNALQSQVAALSQVVLTGGIRGVVQDPAGNPVPAASITFTDRATGLVFPASVATDPQGQFTSPPLPPANYDVRFVASGLKDLVRFDVPVQAGQTTDLGKVGMTVQTGRLEGVVKSAYPPFSVIPQAVVTFTIGGTKVGETLTGVDGRFLSADLPVTNAATIQVSAAGFLDVQRQLITVEHNKTRDVGELSLTPVTGLIRGRVEEQGSNTPLTGALVEFLRAGQVQGQVNTTNGAFTSGPLVPGVYDIRVSQSGYITVTMPSVQFLGFTSLDVGTIQLPLAQGRLGGRVIDNQVPAQPVAGATVSFRDNAGTLRGPVLTDASGQYLSPLLPLGTHTVVASKTGYVDASRGNQAVLAGTATAVPDIVLPKAILGGTITLGDFVPIPAGTFQMGSTNGNANERPVVTVTISKSFLMQKTEVTQGQWQAVMGSNPSFFTSCGPTCPVERVLFSEVQAFIAKLNMSQSGVVYRLPTEAEWEYAARAGTTGDFGGTGKLDEMGWYSGNSQNRTRPVAQRFANAWGLYDMHGNVWEWVQDWYALYPAAQATDPAGPSTGTTRVLRGGAWDNVAFNARSAYRHFNYSMSLKSQSHGFRLVAEPVSSAPAATLVAHYKLDGDVSDALGGNSGVLQGPVPAQDRFGATGALAFDGVNDFASVPSSSAFDFKDGPFSVAFWVRFDDLTDGSNGLLHKDSFAGGTFTARGWLFNICLSCRTATSSGSTGGVGLEVRNVTAGSGTVTHARVATSLFQVGKWHHVAGVRFGGSVFLYVDGQLRATTVESTRTDVSNTSPLEFGVASPRIQWFKGRLDDVRIYRGRLNDGQLKALCGC